MALSLGLKVKNDVIIDDGKCRLQVNKICEDKVVVTVTIKGTYGIKTYSITEEESTEVYPNVRISLGNTGDMETSRLLFEAPRSIKLVRGFIHRKEMELYANQMGFSTNDAEGSREDTNGNQSNTKTPVHVGEVCISNSP